MRFIVRALRARYVRVTCAQQPKRNGGIKRKLKEKKTARIKEAKKGKTIKGDTKKPEPTAPPEEPEDIIPLSSFQKGYVWMIDILPGPGHNYLRRLQFSALANCDMVKLTEGARVVYWIGKPFAKRAFYTAIVQKKVKSDGNYWLKFDIDGTRAKVPDLVEERYMKSWALLEDVMAEIIPESSSVPPATPETTPEASPS